jgi:glycosyltransferase involved in cell wall biosynthesis
MKIGIDYTAAIHQSAGIGRYTRELINTLASASTNGVTPHYRLFVADAGRQLDALPPGPNFSWCPTRITERWLARLWFRLHLPLPIQTWTGPLDLYHATDFVLPPVMPQTRTIVTIHDLSFVREPAITMPGMSRYLNTWVPHSVNRADHVIAVSEATRQDLIELYHTPPDKISVLHHGVGSTFKPITDAARLNAVRNKYSLDDAPFVLSVGTIQPRKNYRRLIQAFAHIDPPVKLVIGGGKGWQVEEVLDEVARLGLTNRIHFPGYIADEDLPALYSAAILFIYPSLYEGFGLPALEAMACGTPVIASNQSSLPEVVGNAGLLVDPRDVEAIAAAMGQLLEDDNRRREISALGLQQAARFTWPEMGVKLLDLYKKVLSKQ